MMVRRLYSLLMGLLQPVARLRLRQRARAEPVYGERVAERFGRYGADVPSAAKALAGSSDFYVWVHAVSLGETRAAQALIGRLRETLPGMRLLLTHGTATGRTQGLTLLQPGDVQVWQPWDTPGAVQRFLAHFQPRVGLLVETEVWPNMVAECAAAHMPLCLVNARFSEKSLRQVQRFAWLARPAYQGLHAVWAQSEEDAMRLRQAGARVAGVTGNFKFDITPDASQLARGTAWRRMLTRPVLVFASSREGEEARLLDVLNKNMAPARVNADVVATKNIASSVQWLIVPRHPQRFDAVARLCQEQGFSVSRRSGWSDGPHAADIWIGDSLGEMALYFALSDLALLGGSFEALGGQNLIEAAACGCPVAMGPHTFNFAPAAALALANGAALEVPDMAQAVDRCLELLQSPSELARCRAAALSLGQAHTGAARRTADAVRQLLFGGGVTGPTGR
jgi:3-deoxy-D-manno-octulosonic-acid transferase